MSGKRFLLHSAPRQHAHTAPGLAAEHHSEGQQDAHRALSSPRTRAGAPLTSPGRRDSGRAGEDPEAFWVLHRQAGSPAPTGFGNRVKSEGSCQGLQQMKRKAARWKRDNRYSHMLRAWLSVQKGGCVCDTVPLYHTKTELLVSGARTLPKEKGWGNRIC